MNRQLEINRSVAASTSTGFPLPEMSHRIFQPLKHYSRADLLVESFDAFNEPSLHFTLTA
jgi:hypothetical protein